MPEWLKILLDNPTSIYYPGTKVSGRVTITLTEPMKLRGVRLLLSGQASVHWTEERNDNSSNEYPKKTDDYSATESYVNREITIWANAKEQKLGDSEYMAAGRTTLPFQFLLPTKCPASFEGEYGSIRYFVEVTLDRPWALDDTARREFTVVGLYDLNSFPALSQAVQIKDSKTLGMLCCKSGTLQATVSFEKTGYVAGEPLPVSVLVENRSGRPTKRVDVELRQTVDFSARGSSKSSSTAIVKKSDERDVAPNGSQRFEFKLRVPAVSAMLDGCSIISVAYALIVDVVPHGPSFSLTSSEPIKIGAIPLQDSFAEILPAPQGALVVPPLPGPLLKLYPKFPAPAFNVAAVSSDQHGDDSGESNLRGYAYYNFRDALSSTAEAAVPASSDALENKS